MKIHLTKKGMTRYCQPNELELMQSAGWTESNASKEQAGEEVIRLKPPVKSKATVTAVEEANINKGDE
ncbi:hypothetical protein UFOVP389_36 [uncultured Caudovirales phage]|uniref:Uncharacterized protein n=1 Tax=uncultured Caudovirales phage TaxID=2100421 RepID=A0A6J7X130_9CAUD|nr:hypothetical protein UFOVP389_36 [uncultured Caudovirales phage]